MIRIDKCPYIEIDLEPGIYVFDTFSGMGKTYLGELMTRYRNGLAVYTYNDVRQGLRLENHIRNLDKAILLDRYDMYSDIVEDDLLSRFVSKGGVVLVDCKDLRKIPNNASFCDLELKSNGIRVDML